MYFDAIGETVRDIGANTSSDVVSVAFIGFRIFFDFGKIFVYFQIVPRRAVRASTIILHVEGGDLVVEGWSGRGAGVGET